LILFPTGLGQQPVSVCYNGPFFNCPANAIEEEDVVDIDAQECCRRGYLAFTNAELTGDPCNSCTDNSICYNDENDNQCEAPFPGVGLGSIHDCCLVLRDGGTFLNHLGICNQCGCQLVLLSVFLL